MRERQGGNRGGRDFMPSYSQGSSHPAAPTRQKSPDEQATDRVSTFRSQAEATAKDAAKLAQKTVLEEWRLERSAIDKGRQQLADVQAAREQDASVSEHARADFDAAKLALAAIDHELARAKEPRPKPPIAGELDIEPRIVDRSAHPDDVLAWVAGLGATQRNAIVDRLADARTRKSEDRDAFAVELANYLSDTRMLKPFQRVLADPSHFSLATYEVQRAARNATSTTTAAATSGAPQRATNGAAAGSATAPAHGGEHPLPVPTLDDKASTEPEREPVDSILRRMIEQEEPDPIAIGSLDGSTRRELARRLEHYRLGSGDELAARFARLDHGTRVRLLDALRSVQPSPSAGAAYVGASPSSLVADKVHIPKEAESPLVFPMVAPIIATNDAAPLGPVGPNVFALAAGNSSAAAASSAQGSPNDVAPPKSGINTSGFIDHSDGANIRSGPAEAGGQLMHPTPLPPATRVFVSGTHPRASQWLYVTAFVDKSAIRGYVQDFRVTTDLPEPTAKLYEVKSGDTAEKLAVQEFKSGVRDGHDLRYYENVLLKVNKDKGRAGITGSYQDPGLFGGGANNVQLVAGHRIWLVSPAYAHELEGIVPDGSLTNGAYGKVKRFARHLVDIVKSVTDSPDHFGEVAGEYAQAIRDHIVEIVGIVAGFIVAEAASAFLAATPTGVGQIAAVLIQLCLAAMGAAGMVQAGVEALKHASQWLTIAWTANGKDAQIAAASKEFLKMLVSIAMAALSYTGMKANIGKAATIASSIEIPMMPAMALVEGPRVGGPGAGAGAGVNIGGPGTAGPVGAGGSMMVKHEGEGGTSPKEPKPEKPSSENPTSDKAPTERPTQEKPTSDKLPAERSTGTTKEAGKTAALDGAKATDSEMWQVDPAMRAADEQAGLIVDGSYIKNPTAKNLKSLLNESGKIGSKEMSGEFMYVVDAEGNIIIGTRAGQRMPHPTLVGGKNPTVKAAGIVDIRGGRIYSVNNASGHFKPGSTSLDAARAAFEELPKKAFRKDFKGYVEYE